MKTFEVDTVQIKDKKMIRDMNSKAVLNTDIEGLQSYKDRCVLMQKLQNNDALECEVRELKEMIKSLLGETKKKKSN